MKADQHRDDEPASDNGRDWPPEDLGLRARGEEWFKNLPVLGGATDPAAGLILWIIAIVSGVAFALAGDVFFQHDKDARSHVIQLAGGVIILFGAYFTARQLMNAQTQKYAERLSSTLEQLGSARMSVRISAIRLLQGMLLESHGLARDKSGRYIEAAWKAAIRDALRAFAEAEDPEHVNDPDRRLAGEIWPTIDGKQSSDSHDLHFSRSLDLQEEKRRR
jgi:hypothetical protein